MKLGSKDLGRNLFTIDVITAIIGICISIFLAKLWGTKAQGTWSILNNFTSTCAMICSAGIPSVILSMIRRNELAEIKIWRQTIYYVVFIGSILSVVLYLVSHNLDLKFLLSDLTYSLGGPPLVAIQITTLVLINILGAWMDAKHKLIALSRLRLFLSLGLGSSIFLCYFIFRDQPSNFIYSVWYCYIIQALLLVVLILYALPAHSALTKIESTNNSILSIISQSGWVYLLSDIFQKLNYKADIWFLAAYKGNDQVGVYSIAGTLSLFLLLRSRNSQRVLINAFVKDDIYQNNFLLVQEVKVLAKDTFLLSMLFLGAAFLLFKYFLGPAYQTGFAISTVLIVGIYVLSITMPYSAYFVYLNMPKFNAIAAAMGLCTNIICNWIWVPCYGIWGATWASICTYFITALSLKYLYHKLYAQSL